MTGEEPPEVSDLADDIVQEELPQHAGLQFPGKKTFKPWHRVHKQFIRERQWNHEIAHLVKRLRRELQTDPSEWGDTYSDDAAVPLEPIPETLLIERPLRCFTLPGAELLDIRCLWGLLQAEGVFLRFLGFDCTLSNNGETTSAIAEAAITQLPRVAKKSTVVRCKFQDIARKNTQAWRYFKDYGPYDVVNLDLCDSLIPRGQLGEMSSQCDAIMRLLEYQNQNQRSRWLLFATTQVDRTTLDQVEMNKFAQPTRMNVDSHLDFAKEIETRAPGVFTSTHHHCDIDSLNAEQLVNIFGIVLGKWLCSVLSSASPRWTVKLLRSYKYVIKSDPKVHMLSLGFAITPHTSPPLDSTGMSTLPAHFKPIPSELELAMQFLRASQSVDDVDQILSVDAEERTRLAEAQADFLEGAGFDRAAYLKWVQDGEITATW